MLYISIHFKDLNSISDCHLGRSQKTIGEGEPAQVLLAIFIEQQMQMILILNAAISRVVYYLKIRTEQIK